MGNYEQLKQSVSDVIKTNGNQEITGSILQNVLLTIISTVGANATFAGIATPATNPGTPDGSVFYLASESGIYTNFNAIELQDGLSVLLWNGSWNSQQIFGIDDEPTDGSNNLVKSGGVYAKIKSLEDAGYIFAGIATPSTNPGTPNHNIFYIASEAGTYSNFGNIELQDGLSVLMWNGSWSSQQIFGVDDEPTAGSDNLVKSGGIQQELALGAVYDVSAKNPTAGTNNDGKFESLSALLEDANLDTLIPISVRKGGMSIKFVQSSGNKYVQARCFSNTFSTNVTDWEDVTNEIIDLKKNVGVFYKKSIEDLNNAASEQLFTTQYNGMTLWIYVSSETNGNIKITSFDGEEYHSEITTTNKEIVYSVPINTVFVVLENFTDQTASFNVKIAFTSSLEYKVSEHEKRLDVLDALDLPAIIDNSYSINGYGSAIMKSGLTGAITIEVKSANGAKYCLTAFNGTTYIQDETRVSNNGYITYLMPEDYDVLIIENKESTQSTFIVKAYVYNSMPSDIAFLKQEVNALNKGNKYRNVASFPSVILNPEVGKEYWISIFDENNSAYKLTESDRVNYKTMFHGRANGEFLKYQTFNSSIVELLLESQSAGLNVRIYEGNAIVNQHSSLPNIVSQIEPSAHNSLLNGFKENARPILYDEDDDAYSVIEINTQEQFDNVRSISENTIINLNTDVEFTESHISVNNSALKLVINGNGHKIKGSGTEFAKSNSIGMVGTRYKHSFTDTFNPQGLFITDKGEVLDTFGDFFSLEGSIDIYDVANKICRIPTTLDDDDPTDAYIMVTCWYYSKYCKISKITDGYIYFIVDDLSFDSVRNMYNINYDTMFGINPRYRLVNYKSAIEVRNGYVYIPLQYSKVTYVKTTNFINVTLSELIINDCVFAGNISQADNSLIIVSNKGRIKDCQFIGMGGAAVRIGGKDFYIIDSEFVGCYAQSLIIGLNGSENTVISACKFYDLGKYWLQSSAIVAVGKNYLIQNNRFVNYGLQTCYLGANSSLDGTELSEISGRFEQNTIYFTDEYRRFMKQYNLCDCGAIYASGISDETVIIDNVVYNYSSPDENNLVYLDDGCKNAKVIANVLIVSEINQRAINVNVAEITNHNTNIVIGYNVMASKYDVRLADGSYKAKNFIYETKQGIVESLSDNVVFENDLFIEGFIVGNTLKISDALADEFKKYLGLNGYSYIKGCNIIR